MKNNYSNGIRYRAIVSAWQEDESGERVTNSIERLVCVEVDTFPPATQAQRASQMAQALIQALYPRVNQFDIYNIVDEVTAPDQVLGYVTGWSMGRECYESDPVVAFRQPHNPAQYRAPNAMTWEEERIEYRRSQLALPHQTP